MVEWMRNWLIGVLLGGVLLGSAQAEDVWLLTSSDGSAQTWVGRLQAALPAGVSLGIMRIGDAPLMQQCPGARVVLAEGDMAASAAVRGCSQARVWAFSLSSISLERLRQAAPTRVTGVPSDVPPARQVAVLAALRPRLRSIAVPYSQASEAQARVMERALRADGFQPVLLPTDPETQPLRPLREVLGDVQAVIALPDPALYHEGLLKHWLLMTAREGVPMLGGLGAQDVRRGMVAAAVQSGDGVLARTIEFLPWLLSDPALPPPQSVEAVDVLHNPLMLERLGLKLEEAR